MIALVWQFEVQQGKNDDFEALYGADGAWTALSRRSRSFLGSSFLQDLARPERYLLVEYWSEMVVYEKHRADFEDAVSDLEQRRESIVKSMQAFGLYNALDTPDRAGPTWSQRSGH